MTLRGGIIFGEVEEDVVDGVTRLVQISAAVNLPGEGKKDRPRRYVFDVLFNPPFQIAFGHIGKFQPSVFVRAQFPASEPTIGDDFIQHV